MSSVSYYQPPLERHATRSPSTLMPHLLLPDYPNKVQPRSSAARHKHLLPSSTKTPSDSNSPSLEDTTLDNVDAEASSILIALANQNSSSSPTKESPSAKPTNNDTNNAISAKHTMNDDENDLGQESIINAKSMSIHSLLGNGNTSSSPSELTSQRQSAKDGTAGRSRIPSFNGSSGNELQWKHAVRPDPIMLLAAAAAAIDDEDNKMYRSRKYERREILLTPRYHERRFDDRPSDNGRPSFYRRRSSSRSHHQSSSDMDTSEAKRRHRYTSKIDANAVHRRPPYHTRNSTDSYHDEPQESEPTSTQPSMTQRASPSSSEANTFSWQYLSMKQNPKIKRNAMHAYITYMIYTDMAQERSRVEAAIATNGTTMHDYRAEPATIMGYASETKENDPPPYGVRRSFEDETRKAYASMDQSPSVAAAAIRTEPNHSMIETTPYSNHHGGLAMAHPGDGLHHRPGVTETSWYANTMSAASYRLPPSPNQRYDGIPPTVGYPTSAPSSSSIMGRPLTAFLWDEPGSAPSAAHPERRHESVTLPPLTRPFSSMPVNADFDRSHML